MSSSLLSRIQKNFRDIRYLDALKRVFDQKPIHCNMYVTDRCNLNCGYCTEFDNSKPHPETDVLRRRIDKVVSLGVIKLALVGGEPLLHPDIDQLIAHAKAQGITVSISTNGFLLKEAMIERLLKANLDIIQISVDRKTPSDVTKKALDLLGPIIENLRKTAIKLHISGVICADTIDEAESVLRYGLEHDIPTELRLMHGDLAGNPKTDPVSHERGRELLDLQVRLKQAGQKVHTTNMILDYQLDTLAGKDIHWKCLAGYKIFFVSADGYFWPCSLLKSDKRIEDITPADLLAYNSVKDCQPKCGIYCAVSNSLFLEQPAQFILREIPARLKQTLRQRRD